MAINENNRAPISKVAWYDGIVPKNADLQTDQDALLQHVAYLAHDFAGSGVLQSNPVVLPPILDTANPNSSNISFSILNAGNYDGLGIFVDRQPVDNVYGDQLLVTLSNVSVSLYNPPKVIVFGKIYDPSTPQGIPVIETLVFPQAGSKATYNYFISVIAVFVNNFSGGIGRTDLSATAQTSLNSSSTGQTARLTIAEVGPLQVLAHNLVINQNTAPNIDVRDFVTSTITRKFIDELTFVVNTAQNTNYVPVSLTDLNLLPLNTTGIAAKPFLDNTTNGLFYGQKVYLTTNNIQQLSFSLSLLNDAYGWSGEFVIGIRPLQTKPQSQFSNPIDLDPDPNVLFEASFTQTDLLNSGFVLTTTPQEIKFNFIGTALAQPNAILTTNSYYVITLSRRGDISTGQIIIDVSPKVLTNSKFTSFNATTKTWTDDTQNDLWIKVHSAAVRVASGVAYTTDGTMVSLQKTTTSPQGNIISTIAGPYSLAVVDAAGSDNIVVLQATQGFQSPGEHQRTGNLVYQRITDQVTISVFTSAQFNTLVSSTNNVYQSNFPVILGVVNDLNNKSNPAFNGVITLPGQVRKNQIVLFNTGLSDATLKVNNIIMPNNTAIGIKYRIVNSQTTTYYLGDFDNNKIFTSADLAQQATVQDTFSAQSTNTLTGTSFDPYQLFDTRSRDALGFGKETIEDFTLADVDGYLTINSTDVARLQYLTTTIPALVSPAPISTSIQVLTVENITSKNIPILVAQIGNLDGYAQAIFPDKLSFTARNVGDMRALSVGDTINLSSDGYLNANGQFTDLAYSNLVISKFIHRNDLVLETRFPSNIAPTIGTSYTLTFYNQNPVYNGQLGIFGEVATAVLEFIVPGVDFVASNILPGDIMAITTDALLPVNRNGTYTVSSVINSTTLRVTTPTLPIAAGTANAGIEVFASDGYTDKINSTVVVEFTLNNINLLSSNIQAGDVVNITSGPTALNGVYTIARVISAAVFTVVPPSIALIAQTFNATFEFRAAGNVVDKIGPTAITGAIVGIGPTPTLISNMQTTTPSTLPDGVLSQFSFTLTHVPITGTVNVHWTSGGVLKTMTFSASPVQITGDGNPANSSINRTTGVITIDTFAPPDAGTAITTDYRVAPIVTLKHCYPTVVSSVSQTQTDIEFSVPFINPVSNTDIQGINTAAYVLIQTNNADPPTLLTDVLSNIVSGQVMANTISPTAIATPSRNVVIQLTTAAGVVPNLIAGNYWMQAYSGTRINLPAVQKEFLSDTIGLSSPINWTIQKNNFEWTPMNMTITDYRRFLPASFVSKVKNTTYNSLNEMWVPGDLYVGNGQILASPGVPYSPDIEITKINLDLPVTALLSNNINVYNNLIASYAPTPGFTRAGMAAMKFSDGSYVGANDSGNNTALTKNQVRVIPSINSIYLDGYQVANAPVYQSLDEVLSKLHYEIRMGMYFDDGYGILYFHTENIKSVFANEPIVATGICRVGLTVILKKAGFANSVVSINSTDILRLFTLPVPINQSLRYSIAGQIQSGFTIGVTNSNPAG